MRAISPPAGRVGGEVGRVGEVGDAFCIKGEERVEGPGELLVDKDSAGAPLARGDSSFVGSL